MLLSLPFLEIYVIITVHIKVSINLLWTLLWIILKSDNLSLVCHHDIITLRLALLISRLIDCVRCCTAITLSYPYIRNYATPLTENFQLIE